MNGEWFWLRGGRVWMDGIRYPPDPGKGDHIKGMTGLGADRYDSGLWPDNEPVNRCNRLRNGCVASLERGTSQGIHGGQAGSAIGLPDERDPWAGRYETSSHPPDKRGQGAGGNKKTAGRHRGGCGGKQ